MGAFFTNVQVSTGQRATDGVREAVVGALRAWVSVAGFAEDADLSDDEADRAICVGPAGPEPWIAVYDEATEDQDPDALSALAETLSHVGEAAVSVLVHDSDILEMRLYRDGAEIDTFNGFPNYFDEDADERAPAVGQAMLWELVLAPGATAEALQAAWEPEDVFAEDTLARIAPLLGWDAERCAVGYRYLPEIAPDPDAYTRLAFRATAG